MPAHLDQYRLHFQTWSTGADVLPSLPARVLRLLAPFAALDARQQSMFLDAVNQYLYSSPQQRRRLEEAWSSIDRQVDDDASADADEPLRK